MVNILRMTVWNAFLESKSLHFDTHFIKICPKGYIEKSQTGAIPWTNLMWTHCKSNFSNQSPKWNISRLWEKKIWFKHHMHIYWQKISSWIMCIFDPNTYTTKKKLPIFSLYQTKVNESSFLKMKLTEIVAFSWPSKMSHHFFGSNQKCWNIMCHMHLSSINYVLFVNWK